MSALDRRDFLRLCAAGGAAALAQPRLFAAPGKRKGGISLNYDNSHFYCWHPSSEMTEAGVDAWVDQFAGTEVDELLFCPNSQRSSVASKVRQNIWDGYDPKGGYNQPFLAGIPDTRRWARLPSERQHFLNWSHNAWLLHERGIDPYARWIARCRVHGIRPWISMRMNDIHFVENPHHSIHDRFWKEHPEFRRDPKADYNGQCLDYAHPEVRAYQMAYVREMVFRYDLHGFELDWTRNPFNFRPGHEQEGRAILTDFTADVRRLLDQREKEVGHRILLSARVPDQPDTALALGFDAEAWSRRRLLDHLVVSPFLYSQFDIPMEVWRARVGAATSLDAGLMLTIKPANGGNYSTGSWKHRTGGAVSHNLETARGAAASLYQRGADRMYLFNFFDDQPYGVQGEAYRRSLPALAFHRLEMELGSPAVVGSKSRRHLVTNEDTTAPGAALRLHLPQEAGPGREAAWVVHTGPAPLSDQKVQVRLACDGPAAMDALSVRVNGVPARFAGPIEPALPGHLPTHAFDLPASALKARNDVRIAAPAGQKAQIVWLEIALSGPNPPAPDETELLDPASAIG